jgi:hypothetical protein
MKMMIPEITIKISFSPPPESKAETTVSSTHIAPPESTEAAALADIPAPQALDDAGSSVAFEAPPPPTVDPMEGDMPPLPDVEEDGEVPGEDGEPPPAPSRGRPPGRR